MLQWDHTRVRVGSWPWPPGCHKSSSSDLLFNTNTSSTASCSTSATCICMFNATKNDNNSTNSTNRTNITNSTSSTNSTNSTNSTKTSPSTRATQSNQQSGMDDLVTCYSKQVWHWSNHAGECKLEDISISKGPREPSWWPDELPQSSDEEECPDTYERGCCDAGSYLSNPKSCARLNERNGEDGKYEACVCNDCHVHYWNPVNRNDCYYCPDGSWKTGNTECRFLPGSSDFEFKSVAECGWYVTAVLGFPHTLFFLGLYLCAYNYTPTVHFVYCIAVCFGYQLAFIYSQSIQIRVLSLFPVGTNLLMAQFLFLFFFIYVPPLFLFVCTDLGLRIMCPESIEGAWDNFRLRFCCPLEICLKRCRDLPRRRRQQARENRRAAVEMARIAALSPAEREEERVLKDQEKERQALRAKERQREKTENTRREESPAVALASSAPRHDRHLHQLVGAPPPPRGRRSRNRGGRVC